MNNNDRNLPAIPNGDEKNGGASYVAHLAVLRLANGAKKILCRGDTIPEEAVYIEIGLYEFHPEENSWHFLEDICTVHFV